MRQLQFYLLKLGKNKKNFYLQIVMQIFLSLIFCIFLGYSYSPIFYILLIPAMLIIYFFNYSVLIQQYRKLVNSKEIAFQGFYRNLLNYLENNETLFGALNLELEEVDNILLPDVQQLIQDMNEDTSLQPFLTFSENFHNELIKQMILILYQTQESGVLEEVLENINSTLMQMNNKSIETHIEFEKKKIEKYHFYPLLLSAAIIILFAVYSLITLGGNFIV